MDDHQVVCLVDHTGSGDEHDVIILLQIGMFPSPAAHLINESGRVLEMA